MRLRQAIPAISAMFVAGVIAACGGGTSDNGEASKSPDAIVSDATAAMGSLHTVHVAGTTATAGPPTTLDVHLVNGQGGRGQVSQSGLSFNVIALDQSVYLNVQSSVWRRFGSAATAQLIDGRWVKVPASGQFGAFAQLTDLQALFSTLLSNHGTLAKGSTTTVNGQKAIAVNDTTRGGTIYVTTTGKPYMLRVAKSGTSGGLINFDQFNQAVSINPPANAVDVSQLPSR